jgi:HTH-type transcriptional regulator / antitoxin HigA
MIKKTVEYIDYKKTRNLYGWESISHPGETLRDEIEFLGLTQAEVATRAGCTIQTINRIVNEREGVSHDMALKLERIFEGHPSAEFWMNMQSAHDQNVARMKESEKASGEVEFFKEHFIETFKGLQNLGYIEKFVLRTSDNFRKAVLAIKDFFETATLKSVYDENIMGVAFRKYERNDLNEFNLVALIKIGEKKARKFLKDSDLKEYDEKVFLSRLPELKSLTKKSSKEFLKELQDICKSLGVIVIYVPNMKHTHLGGATTWLNGHPVIILKQEKQWVDTFWFNFFHEAAHIVKHSKKEFFVDVEKDKKNDAEHEADNFAQKILIPNFEEITAKFNSANFQSWLKESAESAGVSESIIAGRVGNRINEQKVWRILSPFRPTIKEKVEI